MPATKLASLAQKKLPLPLKPHKIDSGKCHILENNLSIRDIASMLTPVVVGTDELCEEYTISTKSLQDAYKNFFTNLAYLFIL